MFFTKVPFLTVVFWWEISDFLANSQVLALQSQDIIQPISASSITKSAQQAGQLAIEFFNSNWVELTKGQSYIYEAVVKVCLALANVLIACWAIPFFNTLIQEGWSDKSIEQMIYPLLVVFMLGINHGSLLSSSSLLLRNIGNGLNERILTQTINGIKVGEAIVRSNMNQAYQQMLNSKIAECKLLPNVNLETEAEKQVSNQASTTNQSPAITQDPQTKCIDQAVEEVKSLATQQAFNNVKGDVKLDFDVSKILVQGFNDSVLSVLLILFSAFQLCFVFLVEIASILNAYIAPVFLSLSLLPGQSKLIHAWLSGWLSLTLIKISYTIIVGMTASSIVNNQDMNPLFMPLMQGILSPILAFVIASGGGLSLFNALSSIGSNGLHLLVKSRMGIGKANKGYNAKL